jgi:hypothetical protein
MTTWTLPLDPPLFGHNSRYALNGIDRKDGNNLQFIQSITMNSTYKHKQSSVHLVTIVPLVDAPATTSSTSLSGEALYHSLSFNKHMELKDTISSLQEKRQLPWVICITLNKIMALLSWVMLPRVPEVLKYQEGISDTLASF